MAKNGIELFLNAWEWETGHTVKLLKALPAGQYDFRPDPAGRSLGELAWHLAEIDAYFSHGIERGSLQAGPKPPGLERPRTIEALAPGFERIHRDAVARVSQLKPEDLDRTLAFFDGSPIAIRNILWNVILHHSIHHRGQLQMMVRLAGGVPPSMYGPGREETLAAKAQAQSQA